MTITADRLAIQFFLAIGDCVRDLGEVPSGHLYACLLSMPSLSSMTAGQYQQVIDALNGAGLVSEKNHLLTWVGPRK